MHEVHTDVLTTMRAVGVVGLLSIALVHLLDVVDKIQETPYIGWLYIALMLSALVVAGLLLFEGSARAWAATGLLAVSVLAGFILSRTTGLPNATGDIGNWSEGLGLASMFVEGCVVVLAGAALALLGGLRTMPKPLARPRVPRTAAH